MRVSDKTIQAEGLQDFFKNLGEKRLNVSKKMARSVLINRGRALYLPAKGATAAVSKSSEQALTTLPKLITFYNTGKCLYLGKIVHFMLSNWKRKQKDHTHLLNLKVKKLI